MRSWTTFILFGIVVVALILYTQLSRYSTTTHPAVLATQAFFSAVKNNNAADAIKYLDASNSSLNTAGNNIISLNFKQTMLLTGAFIQQPAVTWLYYDLANMQIDTSTTPHEDEAAHVATVRLVNGDQVFLKKDSTGWKVRYIMRLRKHN